MSQRSKSQWVCSNSSFDGSSTNDFIISPFIFFFGGGDYYIYKVLGLSMRDTSSVA